MKKIWDISVALQSKMPLWPQSHGVHISQTLDYSRGDDVMVSRLDIGVHSGTHIDAPLHFVKGGKTTNEIDMNKLIGMCQVIDMNNHKVITAEDLDKVNIEKGVNKLLFHTDNSLLWNQKNHKFYKDYCALSSDAAQWVVDHKIDLVGIDYLSIQKFFDPPDTHLILLHNEVVILETIDLRGIKSGLYNLYCLPLKVHGLEGAPARVVLGQI